MHKLQFAFRQDQMSIIAIPSIWRGKVAKRELLRLKKVCIRNSLISFSAITGFRHFFNTKISMLMKLVHFRTAKRKLEKQSVIAVGKKKDLRVLIQDFPPW
ncbi:hypothetical protein Drorol1_Dr00021435 [Drosera rotundifolia]